MSQLPINSKARHQISTRMHWYSVSLQKQEISQSQLNTMFDSIYFYFYLIHIRLEQCPPGTMARVRLRANQKYQNSLMPFCRKCPPAQYQPNYNQIKCMPCPLGMSSPRGSISVTNCFSDRKHICEINSAICGPHGICVPENGNQHLYSCLCVDGYAGEYRPLFSVIAFHLQLHITLCGTCMPVCN